MPSSFSFLFPSFVLFISIYLFLTTHSTLPKSLKAHLLHRLASSWVSPMFLREGTVLSGTLPNMHLPPAATTCKAQEAQAFPRQAPKTSQILLYVIKSSPLKPPFPTMRVPPDPVAPLPACPLLTAAQPYSSSSQCRPTLSLSLTASFLSLPGQNLPKQDLSLLWTTWQAH